MEIFFALLLFMFGGPLLHQWLDLDRFTPERTGSSKAFNLALAALVVVLATSVAAAIYNWLAPNLGWMYFWLYLAVLDCSIFYCYSPENRRR